MYKNHLKIRNQIYEDYKSIINTDHNNKNEDKIKDVCYYMKIKNNLLILVTEFDRQIIQK